MFDQDGIEWTKPQDIEIGNKFAGLDKPNSFAAGAFGFLDCSVRMFKASADPELFRRYFTVSGNDFAPEESDLYK